jgi:hypothetical protein
VLNQCSRTLQARADSGEAHAKLEDSASPATAVLEVIRRKENRRVVLRGRAKECQEREKALQQKLTTVRSKAETQRALLEACKQGGSPKADGPKA